MIEIQALQNFGDNLNIKIQEYNNMDKRKTIKKYIALINGMSISPQLDYEQMNHFLLGYSRALKIN
jgi:hypothetical protein